MTNASPFQIHLDSTGSAAGIALIRLEQPGRPVVVLDLELIQRLEATLKALPPNAAGLVLASASERVFVAGADLKAIREASDTELHRYLEYAARVFGLIANLPFPTAAAINGAALGGGLELAMHCDALIGLAPVAGSKPYPVGLPECSLGLCPGWGGTNLLPARIPAADAIRRTATGQNMMFDEARAAGLFDAVAESADQLVPRAKAWILGAQRQHSRRDGVPARWIGRPNWAAKTLEAFDGVKVGLPTTPSARAVARAVEAGLTRGWQAALQVERDELVQLRHTPEATSALDAFFAKSSAPKK